MSILRSAIRLAGKKYAIRDITLFDVKGPAVRQPKVATLCAAECETLARCIMAEPDLSGVAYLLALCCGPRLGELCGLKWSDIQFSESVLRINRTAIRIKDGDHTKLVVQPPKTEAALRPIPILNGILMLLVRLRGNAPDDALSSPEQKSPWSREHCRNGSRDTWSYTTCSIFLSMDCGIPSRHVPLMKVLTRRR